MPTCPQGNSYKAASSDGVETENESVNENGKPSTMYKEIHSNRSSNAASQLSFVTGKLAYFIPKVLSLY